MDYKPVSKSTQKKLSVLNEKMQKKNLTSAATNTKKKKKNNKKLSKTDQKDGEQNADGDNQMFGIEGIGVLDGSTGAEPKRSSSDSKVLVEGQEEDTQSLQGEGSLRGEGDEIIRDNVSEVTTDGANVLPQLVTPQSAASPDVPNNVPQKVIKTQKPTQKVVNRIPQSGNRIPKKNTTNEQGANKTVPRSASSTSMNKRSNESLRWDKVLDKEEDEEERIRIYKMNRRKRYLAAAQAKGLGWAANYRHNGSPVSEDSGIDTKDREWNNSSSTSDTHSAKSNRSARSNKSHSSSSDTHPSLTDYGTIKGLGPNHCAGLAKPTLVDC